MNTTSSFPEVHAQTVARLGVDEAAIRRLVHGFYAKVRQDALLGPIFDSRVADWDEHLERMCRFWSSVATMSGTYHGNPMAKHIALPVDAAHFDRWLELFEATAAETCPPVAASLLHRARAAHRPQLRARHRGPCRRPAGPGATLPSPRRLSRPARRAVMTSLPTTCSPARRRSARSLPPCPAPPPSSAGSGWISAARAMWRWRTPRDSAASTWRKSSGPCRRSTAPSTARLRRRRRRR